MKLSRNLKEDKSILKTVKQAFKRAVAVFGIIGVLLFSGFAVKGYFDNQKYTSLATITKTMEELGVENPYLLQDAFTHNYRRLAHNGDEPVYVSFSDEFEKDDLMKESAIRSLDYIFGLVGEINPNYRYKIVSNKELEKQDLLGKSTIKYQFGSLSSTVTGRNEMNLDMQDFAYWDFINTSNRIVVDRSNYWEKIQSYQNLDFKNDYLSNYCVNLLTHELLHVFGFADVYKWKGPEFIINIFERVVGEDKIDKTIIHKDTFMDTHTLDIDEFRKLTLKDYSTLCALYMPKVDESKQADEIERVKQLAKNYKQFLYNEKVEYLKGSEQLNLNGIYCNTGIPIDNIKPIEDISSVEFSRKEHIVTEEDEWFEDDGYKYKIQIEDGEYLLQVFDMDNNLIDSCSGNVYKTDLFTILEDCKFKDGVYTNFEDRKNPYMHTANVLLFTVKGKPKMYLPGFYFNVCDNVVYQNEANIE